jgi:amino acid adenylation domain-containing protein
MSAVNHMSGLTEAERQRVLFDWNRTRTEYPRHSCIHELFEQQAEKRPNAVALKFENQSLTYRRLNERANQVAHYLRALGVGPDGMAGLLMERSIEMIVGLLGILKAGGAYVPLDANYPAHRLDFMIADTRTRVMLVQDSTALSPAKTWRETMLVALDPTNAEISRQSTKNPENLNEAENLAYVMYTSGSTGQPKGVMVSHRAVVRLVKNTDYIDLSENETFLQFSPISFDASTLEIWAPLLNGGCLAIMPPEAQSLEELGAAIQQNRVTTLWLTAGLFDLMVDQRLEDLRPLRQLIVGGDVLSPSHVRKAMNGLPGCTLINGYGPTEGTTFTCCHKITREDAAGTSIPIGRPISNTQVYLLDSENKPAPIGEAGELCIAGDGLARGYLNEPELTANKFVPHTFDPCPQARIYKSGDLARYRSDGVIEFLGRVDNQVKINGYRIEFGEIEAALAEHPQVQSATVVARQDTVGDKKLVAYIVSRFEDCPAAELREFLQQRLPSFMIPFAFVAMDALPLSSNGKVDRSALPAPQIPVFANANVATSPQTETELKIAAVWKQVLGLSTVNLDDNFFDAGGDSLQLLEAHAELQKAISPDITITDLFEYTTIASLARHCTKAKTSSGIVKARDRALKQHRVWARQKRSRGSRAS